MNYHSIFKVKLQIVLWNYIFNNWRKCFCFILDFIGYTSILNKRNKKLNECILRNIIFDFQYLWVSKYNERKLKKEKCNKNLDLVTRNDYLNEKTTRVWWRSGWCCFKVLSPTVMLNLPPSYLKIADVLSKVHLLLKLMKRQTPA